MTPEQIIKTIRICCNDIPELSCEDCPYRERCGDDHVLTQLLREAADAIEQLLKAGE